MRKIFFLFFIALSVVVSAQQLTVEKIMKDPKWMGTSPTNISWTWDSKSVFFLWNPDKNISDSFYIFSLGSKEPVKLKYNEAQLFAAINNGVYNTDFSQIAYSYHGDLFLLDIKSAKTFRITQTEEQETNPKFILKDEWISFNRNQNLFAWNIKTGFTQQLTNFVKTAEPPAVPAFTGNRGSGQRGNNPTTAATVNNQQEEWLKQNQLFTSDVIKLRKNKKDQRDAFLKSVKEPDTLKNISIGDKILQSVQISPDGRFVTYRLYTAPTNAKTVLVHDFVTESGFTADLPNRTKVGAPLGKYEFCVYDKLKDTVLFVSSDSIPGITDQPDYVKDYPQKFANKKPVVRPVIFYTTLWNESGTAAIVDIRSQDNKDRWIMQLDAATGKLKLADRQHDSAWIGGPGISYGARLGWINDQVFYFQSEATGHSHLYTYNISTSAKTQITKGKYEVQDVWLSRSKQNFYLVTNEEHPGKQNFYKIKTDGSSKEKITSRTGGYEVSISPDEKNIAYRYSYITKPWELFIQENASNKKSVQITNKAQSDEFKSYAWRDTKIFTFTARDGEPVHAKLYEPKKGTKNNAAVIFVHGAGYLQNVHYWFSSYFREQMFNNLLADQGYTVLDIDYRGSAGYGRDWRTGIYRFMGGKDLNDEVDAAKYLVKELGIDSTRIGMYGGSYGGFMTLMAMFTAPDVFKAGAALRPVTDWAHYNHGYTSNILNEPFNDSISYARSSPINFANGLKNHLLICHGMVDLNVNFQDAVRLNQRLIELGKDNWQLAVYPVEDHGFIEPSSWTDEYKRILKLFDTWLGK
ncbi:MAG: prolyl oligopeptidase family serine peptidase [Bacteroidota bacterium]|nr:prolyl oligopeptidase family serine peptidase [Bacteroidota bacterium]